MSLSVVPVAGQIISIAHQGDPAPGGGTFRLAFGPAINNRGDVAFIGDLTPAPDDIGQLHERRIEIRGE